VTLRPAVFFDRDGTLIEDRHYARDAAAVSLIPGAAAAVARLRTAGYAIVVATNQSGLARGRITPVEYQSVEARVNALFVAAGAPLDATFMCPHHPDVSGACECRKPAPGLFLRAAAALGLDLARSVLIGDRWRDIAASAALGARGILVPSAETPAEDLERAAREAAVAPDLAAAVDLVMGR